jgi:hypothetical protein
MPTHWAKAARELASRTSTNKLFSELPMQDTRERTDSERKIREFLLAVGTMDTNVLAEELANDNLIMWCYPDKKGVLQVVHSFVHHNFGFFTMFTDMKHVGIQSDSFQESPHLVQSSDGFTRTKSILAIVGDDTLKNERWFADSSLPSPLAVKNAKDKAHTLDSLHFTGCADNERPRFVMLPKLFPFRVGQKVPIGSKLNDIINNTAEKGLPWGLRVYVEGMAYCMDWNGKMSLNAPAGKNRMFEASSLLDFNPKKMTHWSLHNGEVFTEFPPLTSDYIRFDEIKPLVMRKTDDMLVAWFVQSPAGEKDDAHYEDAETGDDGASPAAKRARVGEISDQGSP